MLEDREQSSCLFAVRDHYTNHTRRWLLGPFLPWQNPLISHQTSVEESLCTGAKLSLSLFSNMLPDAAGWLSEGTSKPFQGCLPDLRANWYKPAHVPAATPGGEDLGRNCLLLHALDAPWRKWFGLCQH